MQKIERSQNRNGAPVESRYHFPPACLRTGAAAHYCGLSRRTMFALASRSAVAVIRVSPRCLLFRRSDLDAFLARRRVAAIGEVAS